MLVAFLTGLLVVLIALEVILIAYLTVSVLKDIIAERLRQDENHQVVFVDTKEVVDDYLKNRAEETEAISMEELEAMCEKTPYVVASVEKETHDISNYKGFKAQEVAENLNARMKQQNGMVIFEG